MEALFIFIIKSSGLIALFYFAYFFLLRKETFFTSSRWFLLAGLVTSVILPLVVYTKVIWIDPAPVSYLPMTNYHYLPNHKQHFTTPEESLEINWYLVSLAVYALGFTAFMIKFGIDFYSLNSVLKGKKIEQQADFKFVDVNENIAPFSYFDYIVYNSSMYSEKELESILEHEKVHSDQHHTIDVIISRIFCILFWFNPLIWLYKKAILQNLEFIADSEAAKKISDKKAYQYTLLKITTHETCVAITNHFYQSLIKKRIVMLNKNQSKKRNYWKYYAVLPALVTFVLLFQIKTIAQEKEKKAAQEVIEPADSVDVFKIKKSTTDQQLKEMAGKLKKNHDVDVVISDVKRNSKDELTAIKIDVKKGNEENQTIQIEGNKAIKDCGIIVSTADNGSKKIDIVTNGGIDKPIAIQNRVVQVREFNNPDMAAAPTPPSPPAVPALIDAPKPPVCPIDMPKMPKAPVMPKNMKNKVSMAKFEKEMEEFDKKMEALQPEMDKYDIAMEKFGEEMDKYSAYIDQQLGPDFEKKMEQFEKEMKVFEKTMKEQEKQMMKIEKENKRS
ncbi:M56 family metallopeptidase [Flavobacterium johnsoniae]|uniref:Peptidase M56 n=1 Tax=Flavobacterium johnsoniae TaxID=986 RepID=A0A1J7BQ90_FLAJO|nr:M56 family metallopeptidase [Flavobacterium johnsoniae]OIV40863.1 peptidase M56 [Flavobacterium johnsoniae]